MTLQNAMLTGATGIRSNTTTVNTVGDNIANLNTTAFKGQRTLFETLLYQTVTEGEPPSATSGGTNPRQIGFGSRVGTIQRNFAQGNVESTGFSQDLAVEGRGFFVLQDAEGAPLYTRDGAFRLDPNSQLVSTTGLPVQVFPADAEGNVQTGTLESITIPIGSTLAPVATTQVEMAGHLDAGSSLAAAGAVSGSQVLRVAGGGEATDTTALTALVDEDGVALFEDGDVLSVSPRKGGIDLRASTFTVGATGSTLGDLATHLESVFGLVTEEGVPGEAGVAVEGGVLTVRSNLGETNAMELDGSTIRNTTRITAPPFLFGEISPAVGTAISPSSFLAYDSLGAPVEVRVRYTLESRSDAGTTWRFYAESGDDTDLSPAIGNGTISFDPSGRFIAATGTNLSIDRAGSGSGTPVSLEVNFANLTGHANPQGVSQVVMADQDGREAGVMTGYRVDPDGTIVALYDNNVERNLAQVALAMFTNEEGLVAQGDNNFVVGPNSGEARLLAPQSAEAGTIRAGALEQSNVEIAREFINLISAQTGIQSASRVVRTASDMLEELLLLGR
jgi:flagellar hook protein FlgE